MDGTQSTSDERNNSGQARAGDAAGQEPPPTSVRRAAKARLRPLLDRACAAGAIPALAMAEGGHPLPVHYDVRVAGRGAHLVRRLSVTDVALCDGMFGEGPIAAAWAARPRTGRVPPHFTHEETDDGDDQGG